MGMGSSKTGTEVYWIGRGQNDSCEHIEWAHKHGINHLDVPSDQWLLVDYDAHQIGVEQFVRDAAGELVVDDESGWVASRTTVVQLEAGPLPFPNEATS